MTWHWIIEAQIDPSNAATWVDISSYVRTINLPRGRDDDLSFVDPAVLTVLLENDDGRFTPENTLSVYSPKIKYGASIRARVDVNGAVTTRFVGKAIRWDPVWAAGTPGRVALVAVDRFDRLENDELPDYATAAVIRRMSPDGYWPLGADLADLSSASVTAKTVGLVDLNQDWIPAYSGDPAYLPEYFGPSMGVGDRAGAAGTNTSGAAGAAYVPDSPRYGLPNGAMSVHFRILSKQLNPDRNIIFAGTPNSAAALYLHSLRYARWGVYLNSTRKITWAVASPGARSGNAYVLSDSLQIGADQGYTIIITVSAAGRIRMWANGTLYTDAANTIYRPKLRNLGRLYMGAFAPEDANDFYDMRGFGGYISDVAVWGRDISDDSIFPDLRDSWRGWAYELPLGRFERLRRLAGIPVAESIADVGSTRLLPYHEGGSLADVLRQVGHNDAGLVYVDGDGKLVFEGREERWKNRRTIVATFGDQVGETRYAEARYSYDRTDLKNVVEVSAPVESAYQETTAVATDAASIAEYGRRDMSISVDDIEPRYLSQRASLELEAHKGMKMRLPGLELGEIDSDAKASLAASLKLNDLIRVNRRPPGSSAISKRMRVQQITDTVGNDGYSWSVSLSVSDAEVDADIAPYGTAVIGTSRWGY